MTKVAADLIRLARDLSCGCALIESVEKIAAFCKQLTLSALVTMTDELKPFRRTDQSATEQMRC